MKDVIKIGIENIRGIHFYKGEKNFLFIVNDKIYKTNLFVENILKDIYQYGQNININLAHYEINPENEPYFNIILND